MTETALATIDDIPPDELTEVIEAGKEVVEIRRYFEFTQQGVVFHGDPPIEVWGKAVERLIETGQSLPLLIGDMIVKGETAFGERYVQYLPMGYAYGTLRNWAWVCRAVPLERRIESLNFTHYCKVAPLPPAEQARYLKKAAKTNLSANALERLIREKHQLPGPPPLPEVLWEGIGLIKETEEGLACILGFLGELEIGQEVAVTITEVKYV